jgi:hypothetical protein
MSEYNALIEDAECCVRSEAYGIGFDRFDVRLASYDAMALGVEGGLLILQIEAHQGHVNLIYTDASGVEQAVSDQPSERELQSLAVEFARRNPVSAALRLLRIDLEFRSQKDVLV